MMARPRTPPAERILPRLVADPATGCLLWTGNVGSRGYGLVKVPDPARYRTVHRVLYEELVGPVPPGMQLDHTCHTRDRGCPGGVTCRHRLCANLDHLEPVTRRENIRRGQAPAGRRSRQTHCKRGHPLSGVNLHVFPSGNRACKACRRRGARRPDLERSVTT